KRHSGSYLVTSV
nr:Chain B, Adenomatous polyposis coli protein [synthetic construct]